MVTYALAYIRLPSGTPVWRLANSEMKRSGIELLF